MLGPRRAPHTAGETTVLLRIPTEGPLAGATIWGDLKSWSAPVPIERRGVSMLAEVTLPTGTYVYKLRRADGAWDLDPANPRTRSAGGARNNLLVVGGAEEPVLHAPAAPHLALSHDGRILVRAGLRDGAGESLSLLWDEGDGLRESAMTQVGREDEHRFFEVAVPSSGRAVEYLFALADGSLVGRPGGAAQTLRVETAALRPRAPSWWDDAVLYTIFVDRFRKGGRAGLWDVDTAAMPERLRAGGDLSGVTEALPYLADLGVNAVHLTPIIASRSAHRYDAVDPRAVDPALGGEAALGALFTEAHRRGIRVLLDLPITHVHRDFWAFQHVREHGPASPYWGWFHGYKHPFREGPSPGYRHYMKGAWQEPLLRTSNPEVADWLIGTFERWTRFGADGFRVDAAADVPMDLLRRIAPAVRKIRPEAVVFGEVIPDNVHRYTSGALDAATDFPAQEALFDWLLRGAGARRTAEAFSRRRLARAGTARTTLSFTATHDQPRLLTRAGRPEIARLGHLFALLRAPVPSLLYGDEAGVSSEGAGRSFEDAWPDRACFDWDPSTWDSPTHTLFREALRLRRERPALGRGDESFFPAPPAVRPGDASIAGAGADDDTTLVLRRALGGDVVDVVFHAGEGSSTIPLPEGAPSSGRLLLASGEARLDEREALLTLGPFSAAVIERAPPREIEQAISGAIERNRELAEMAYRAGETTTLSLPTNLSLVVTEACNLRCAHCITLAPQKTSSGAARQMAPWVWGALREAFAAADYFAFVHGGESLAAPVFEDVLRAIAAARAGRRYDVHLLTNGVLLDGERARRLLDLGLTSVSFSIDAATPEKNDALRRGGDLGVILGHLREVLAVRASLGVDLRVGISMVAGRSTVDDLEKMGRLAIDLGVDWLKIEEMYPATHIAASELLAPRGERMERHFRALASVLRGSGMVLVDHRDPPGGCPCEAESNPELSAFRAADDHANRARFHPCRAAWEQACIDPDGAVRPVHSHHAPIGTLAETSLFALWNGEAMRALREEALRRVPEARRRGCPHVTART